jgi:hypothetical protein
MGEDGLGVWAISGDDMLEALKHIEEINCHIFLSSEVC